MSAKEWIAAGGILLALVGAGASYGRMSAALEDAQEEIRLLREDVTAINQHFIAWAARHESGGAR